MNSQLQYFPTHTKLMNRYDTDECYNGESLVSNCDLMGYDTVYTVRQRWLVGVSYGTD
jgi:hypothetical protein